jgi:beta-hydroxylase
VVDTEPDWVPSRKPFFERNFERAMLLVILAAEAIIRRTDDGRRVYFDPAALEWTATLEAGWRGCRAELDNVLADRDRIPAFQEVSEEQYSITRDQRWKVYVLSVYGRFIERQAARCPHTTALLRGIPGLRNAMFSILAPGKAIPEHRGIYAGLLRYHLALKVPTDGQECSITVAGERRTWREGVSLIFDDSFPHSVRNDTAEERVVLFADFERPLPWPVSWVNRAVLALLGQSPLFKRPLDKFERGAL